MVALISRKGRELQRYSFKGCRQVVGCIPYRYKNVDDEDEEQVEVLCISSQKGHTMLFPKGGWEMDETMEEAALRETIEEAGVLGNVECKLGQWSFKSKRYDTDYEGYMFPLRVEKELDSWPEENVRTRRWMNVKEAREVCQHWWMKEALDLLIDRLATTSQRDEEEEEEEEEEEISTCMLV